MSRSLPRPTYRPNYDRYWIKQLIWSYFFLLIFEGALRKWVLPAASTPLLVVRDPVVLAAYYLAWRNGWFPRNAFVGGALLLGAISFVVGVLVPGNTLFVALYGFRANFLHLPLIFLIFKMFDARDVERVGYWTLLISIGMAALMVVQFQSPPGAWINAGSEENFKQLSSALGRIRAPGTFSFISGPAYFFPMVAAFLMANTFSNRYPRWLVIGATLSTVTAAVVAGSRGLLLGVIIVFLFGVAFSIVLKPQLALRWIGSLAAVALAVFVLSHFSFFSDGLTVFNQRLENASASESKTGGIVARFFGNYLESLPVFYDAPFFGVGLGVGTNVGAVLLSGKAQFLLAEGEWSRNFLESGPFLGGAFVLYRLALAAWIGAASVRYVARRDPLPLLLFGSCFLLIINGNIGQPTGLGFMVLLSGLCLSAMRAPKRRVIAAPVAEAVPQLTAV